MALVYRAHFALIGKPIYTSKGVNSSALYVFTNTLLDILNTQKPTHIAVAFDTDAPTQRHKDFADYKIQREAMPEDLSAALPHVRSGITTALIRLAPRRSSAFIRQAQKGELLNRHFDMAYLLNAFALKAELLWLANAIILSRLLGALHVEIDVVERHGGDIRGEEWCPIDWGGQAGRGFEGEGQVRSSINTY